MISKSPILAGSLALAVFFPGFLNGNTLLDLSSESGACLSVDFLEKTDRQFAIDCAEPLFNENSTVAQRQDVAWMLFARANQLVEGIDGNGNSVKVPKWMAWPTDADTFNTPSKQFMFKEVPDVSSTEGLFVIPKHVLAGNTSKLHPDGSNEQVTRNDISYNYLFDNQLNTREGLHNYLSQESVHRLEMPIGSIEIKGSWLISQPDFDPHFPEGTFSFVFLVDKKPVKYWFRGMHIMAKFAILGAEEDVFSSENPSWFWTTFELNKNPGGAACTDEHNLKLPPCTTAALNPTGTERARAKFITQKAPISQVLVTNFLRNSGLGEMGFENYAPNGTQIRFTVDADGQTPVILGHTDMEDFSGWINGVNSPNTHQNPAQWDMFHASCHTCHATAAYNPDTGYGYPFTVLTGTIPKGYTSGCYIKELHKDKDKDKFNYYANLSDGYKSLDFMWPITFGLGLPCSVSKLTG